jgi:AMMECR1 domain-containing protein
MKISTSRFLQELRKKPKIAVERKTKSWLSIENLCLKANLTQRKVRQALQVLLKQRTVETKNFVIETGMTGVHRSVIHFKLRRGSNLPKVIKDLKLTW